MAGSTRTRRPPVKTGAHSDIERQIGGARPRTQDPDLDDLPTGWKSSAQIDAEEEERERALRNEYRAQERARARAQNRPPSAPRRAPSSPRSSRSAGRARRTGRPTLANPTGGRLPFLSFDGEGIAGVFFGAVFYALVLSVADYGPSGPKLWFEAKFLNKAAPPKGKA